MSLLNLEARFPFHLSMRLTWKDEGGNKLASHSKSSERIIFERRLTE